MIMSDMINILFILAFVTIAFLIIGRFGKLREKFRTDEGVIDIPGFILGNLNFFPFLIGLFLTYEGTQVILSSASILGDQFSSGVSIIALGLAILVIAYDGIRTIQSEKDLKRINEQLMDIKQQLHELPETLRMK